MFMNLYSAIVGSRSYGLHIQNSDIDVACLGILTESSKFICKNVIDLRPASYTDFVSDTLGQKPRWFFTQWLFPDSFLDDNMLSRYIVENRESIIQARIPIIYQILKQRGDGLQNWGDKLFKTHPKRLTYSTLFYSILANYAEGMTFAEAHKPKGELHDFLIAMRLGQVPLEDAITQNKLERQRVERAAGFYKEAVHPEILREFEQVILEKSKS